MSVASLGARQPDRGLWTAVAVSAVLHLLAVALWQLSDWFVPSAPPPAIVVSLEPPGKGGTRAGAPPAAKPAATPAPPTAKPAPPQPAPKPVAKPEPKPQPKPQPKPAAKPNAVPPPTAKPAAQPEPAPEPSPAPAAGQAPADPAAGLADIRKMLDARKSEQAGDGGFGGNGEGYGLPAGVTGRLYFAQLEAAVRAAWSVPPGARRDPVLIEVRIGADGKLLARSMVRSSGDPLLDRSALAALDRADLPPPPPEFKTPLKLTFQLVPPDR